MYTQAIEESPYDYGTLRNFVYVAENVRLSLRNDNLSWDHHRAVAPLEPKDQSQFLLEAEQQQWSVKKLRAQVAEYKVLQLLERWELPTVRLAKI
jgi:hypothetical protein